MNVFLLTRDTNTCDSRMGADHTPTQEGVFSSAEAARNHVAKVEKGQYHSDGPCPPLNKWYRHSTGLLSWESWNIKMQEVRE
jgi:hypothetical protein